MAHRVPGLSVLGCVMQVRALREWSAVLRATVKELMPGPTRWLPMPWAFQAPSDFALSSSLLSPEVLRQATLYRTATMTMRSTAQAATSCTRHLPIREPPRTLPRGRHTMLEQEG